MITISERNKNFHFLLRTFIYFCLLFIFIFLTDNLLIAYLVTGATEISLIDIIPTSIFCLFFSIAFSLYFFIKKQTKTIPYRISQAIE